MDTRDPAVEITDPPPTISGGSKICRATRHCLVPESYHGNVERSAPGQHNTSKFTGLGGSRDTQGRMPSPRRAEPDLRPARAHEAAPGDLDPFRVNPGDAGMPSWESSSSGPPIEGTGRQVDPARRNSLVHMEEEGHLGVRC